ncbi:MAG: methylated-DNA--[protein]-cysteine S-methyltransferase [Gammaproteobacteria bacterium]|nr:methylated-DNA--[protein]-cysteine S-methyltransferase [Gammaproteobacteria bacterium]
MSYLYGVHNTKFGDYVIAIDSETHNILAGEFITPSNQNNLEQFIANFKKIYKNEIDLQLDQETTAEYITQIFVYNKTNLPIELIGTEFQIKVWQALRKIPFGQTVSYQSIAEQINHPRAVRAVASSIARNKIAYLIPCHRVIRKTGKYHKYRWGSEIKKAMIESEQNPVDTVH